MSKKFAALPVALIAAALVACGGGGSSRPSAGMLPMSFPIDGGRMMVSIDPHDLPARTIGEELPSEGLGQVFSQKFAAVVGGFTQMKYSQVMAFPPGTKITIRNLSKTDEHTFNVVKEIAHGPAHFPASPSLSTTPHGNGILGVGYASGPIAPGKSVTVTLKDPGTYLVGCAFHYSFGMRDVLIVKAGVKPGTQATPMPQATPTPTPTPSGGGGGGW